MKPPMNRLKYVLWSIAPFGPVKRRLAFRQDKRGERWFAERAAVIRAQRAAAKTRQAVPPATPEDTTELIHVYEAISEVYRIERDAAVAALVVAIMKYGSVKHGEAKDEAWKAVASWVENPLDAASVARGVNRLDIPNLIQE